MSISPIYIVFALLLGVLIFGKNLPEVAKQIGSSLLEFKKGLNEMKDMVGKSANLTDLKKDVSLDLDDVFDTEKYKVAGKKFDPFE